MTNTSPHLVVLYVLLTVNSAADALIFEDWSLLLISSLVLKFVAITIAIATTTTATTTALFSPTSLPWSISHDDESNNNNNNNKSPPMERKLWSIGLYVVPLLLNNIYWLNKMPFTWESDLWSVQVDFVVIFYYIFVNSTIADTDEGTNQESSQSRDRHSNSTIRRRHHQLQLSWTVQDMYTCYYTAAGFWKINTSFLDPTSSCSTVFLCQHLAFVSKLLGWSWTTQVQIAKWLSPVTPAATIGVELSMGLGLFISRAVMAMFMNNSNTNNNNNNPRAYSLARYWTRIGLRIILFFHLAVCLTPEPNNISLFALQCACRLVLITDEDACEIVGRKLLGLPASSKKKKKSTYTDNDDDTTSNNKNKEQEESEKPYGLAFLWVGTVSIAYGYQHEFSPLNWSFLFYVPVMIFLLLTLEVEASREQQRHRQHPEEEEKQYHEEITNSTIVMPSKRPIWMTLAVCIAFFYSFCTIVLGTMEEASCNMFSNLKIHGGGNHLILPTGLLFHWYRDSENPYGGGEVRIVSTTSNWLQEIYPNDMSHILGPSPFAADLLTETTTMPPPIFLNPGANRVLGLRERGWVPVPPGQFIPYSVPSLEWKRLLAEAIEREGKVDVTYTHLPGSGGDEIWRGTAWERKINLKVRNGGHIVKCKVQFQNGTKTNCQQSTEIPYNLDDVPWLIRKISLYHGYPILYEHDGKTPRKSIQCFGP